MTPAELRRRRKALGLTQKQLAAVLGRHVITVSKWEAEMQPIDAPETLALALETLERRTAELSNCSVIPIDVSE